MPSYQVTTAETAYTTYLVEAESREAAMDRIRRGLTSGRPEDSLDGIPSADSADGDDAEVIDVREADAL